MDLSAPATPELYRFDDVDSTRNQIYDRVLSEMSNLPPVTNPRYSLSLGQLEYVDPPTASIAKRKQALLSQGSLNRRIRGTWTLADATGRPIAAQTGTVAKVPILTRDGTYVLNGNEYTLANQPRLKPGIFARVKDNGEIESHVNAKGFGAKLHLEPQTGVFRFEIAQSKMPLVSVLRALGATDQQLTEAWGNDTAHRNIAKDDTRVVDKLYQRMFPRGDADNAAAKREAINTRFQELLLDEEVTTETLGAPFKNISADALLAATKKLLAISRGEMDPDDRDAMPYQQVMSAPDLFAERVARGKQLMRQLLWKASAKGNLDGLPHSPFDNLIHSTLMASGLANPIEEINPGEIFDHLTRATRMGEGGIRSGDAIPAESRAVQPTQMGFIDFLRTPESSKVGVDMRLSSSVRRGKDGRLYTQIRDAKTGETRYVSAQEFSKMAIAFPWELKSSEPVVTALVNGRIKKIPRKQVDAEIPHMENAFSPIANMIPMKSAIKGQRAVMASRIMLQALPLVGAEAPLVQSALPDNLLKSYEEEYSDKFGALRAPFSGKVTKVTPDGITIRNKQTGKLETIETFNRFPYNRKTEIHQSALVKPGDEIEQGQLLARSNFTDDKGTTAIGMNARVAYMPYHGYSHEDAIVVSQSFADRAKSQHTYQYNYPPASGDFMGKKAYVSLFAGNVDRRQLDQMDQDGVVKPGTIVQKNDPLILAASPRPVNRKSLLRKNTPSYKDSSIKWEYDTPGEVTDVVRSNKGPTVVVAAIERMQTGDKASNRFGAKGIIGKIVPDDQMPRDADGRPFEVLLNPLGIQSRVNPAQIYEVLLGKIAATRGRPYKIQDFGSIKDLRKFVEQELEKHDIAKTEDVIDPETGKKIPGVLTGNTWLMKLHHTAWDKEQGRGLGEYTAEQQPAKGGEHASKRLGMLAINAMLSHNAVGALREAGLIRGQANPDYMVRYMAGYKPDTPKIPFVYKKFVNNLKAAGINVIRDGPRNHIMALTDKDVDEMTQGRTLQSADTVDWKTMEGVKGGLFDQTLTGGHPSNEGGGNLWSKIDLPDPYPNPVMEDPIRRVLGLTKPQFLKILSGEEELEGKRGPQAIYAVLDKISLPNEIEKARRDIASGKKTKRDAAVRKLGYLRAAERVGIHPRDWMLHKVPVLPPAFRPVSIMSGNKIPLVADPNYLYKELFDAIKVHGEAKDQFGDDIPEERLNIYNAFKAIVGLGDPSHPKNVERGVKGVLKGVFGSSPKYGAVQRQLLSSTVDFVGRAVIAPDADLGMDEVAIPEDSAWEIYTPILTRRLVRRGWKRPDAAREIETRSPAASEELRKEMADGVVIIHRAPELHRYGVMAARPKITKHPTMKLPPQVLAGFGADFDGDQMNIHVPIGEAERRDALEKMLPSKNLLSISDFQAHQLPSHEFLGGLYTASTAKSDKPVRTFASKEDALAAYRRGELSIDQQVRIMS